MPQKILVVDDEPDICDILRLNFEIEGYEVETYEEPPTLGNDLPDLILLDVMMTPKSGFEWAMELKADARTASIPIIFCTAKAMEDDILQGFALGSDDYVCKPFRIKELKARVKAVLMRSQNEHDSNSEKNNLANIIQYKGLILNTESKECHVDGTAMPFTKIEFEVLALLMSNPGQVFSREKILHEVWQNCYVTDRTVDVNIARIRKKIGNYSECLQSRFGYGYIFRNK